MECTDICRRPGLMMPMCMRAQEKYGEALQLAPEGAARQRAVYHANLAACHLKAQRHEDAVADASEALRLAPGYVKALMRRAAAYEALDDLEHALADSVKVLHCGRSTERARIPAFVFGGCQAGRHGCAVLPATAWQLRPAFSAVVSTSRKVREGAGSHR